MKKLNEITVKELYIALAEATHSMTEAALKVVNELPADITQAKAIIQMELLMASEEISKIDVEVDRLTAELDTRS